MAASLKYYTVFYRSEGGRHFLPANERSIPNSYESYPVLYQTRHRAEAFAAGFREEAGVAEVRVIEVDVTPPEPAGAESGVK